MSSPKDKENSSNKKNKVPFFSSNRKPKSTAQVGTSPSKDNTVRIAAIHDAQKIVQAAAAAALRPRSKKVKKSKAKPKPAAENSILADSPLTGADNPEKPKVIKLAKLFKKYGDREIPKPKKASPPELLPAEAAAGPRPTIPSVTETEETLKQAASDKTEIAVDNTDAREKAAIKIQAAFRGLKERRLYLATVRKTVKIQAVIRGFLARQHVADQKKVASIISETGGDMEEDAQAQPMDKLETLGGE